MLKQKQKEAIDLINSGRNVFLTGAGGTGKSYVIEQITTPKTVLAAPTGIAALNIKGVTAHKTFGIPIGLIGEYDYRRPSSKVREFLSLPFDRVILDECFRGDVEVLTSEGFQKFRDLRGDEFLAQVNSDSGDLSFCEPLRFIEKEYSGSMINFSSAYKFNVSCTENHQMLVYRPTGSHYKTEAKGLKMLQGCRIKSSGHHTSGDTSLSIYERLCIAYQADGYTSTKEYSKEPRIKKMVKSKYDFDAEVGKGSMGFAFKKQRKVDRFLELFSDLELVDYGLDGRGYRKFLVRNVWSPHITKDFTECFKLTEFSSTKSKDFLEELKFWDGSELTEHSFIYSNTNKNSCDFVQSLCCMCGAVSGLKWIPDHRKESYKDCYKLTITLNRDFCTMGGVKKTSEHYSGKVYCVEVPEGNIVIRSNGRTHVVGNCGMIRSDQLDFIDKRLRYVRGVDQPFGGVQVVVVGDFFQLEPIVPQNEQKFFYEKYDSPFAFDADCWDFEEIELDEVVRQEDERQVRLLNSVRKKDHRSEKALRIINKESQPYDRDKEVLHLCCYKRDAERTNKRWYRKVRGQEHTYEAVMDGYWSDSEVPVDEVLKLRVGCKVVLCANDEEGEYVNGEQGHVKKLGEDLIIVEVDNKDGSKRTVEVKPFTWEKVSYARFGEEILKVPEAMFVQFPVQLGYAITVHRSQGMTIDGLALDIGRGCFSAGQLYVALSRVRDLRNMSIVRSIGYPNLIVNQDVVDFYQSLQEKGE